MQIIPVHHEFKIMLSQKQHDLFNTNDAVETAITHFLNDYEHDKGWVYHWFGYDDNHIQVVCDAEKRDANQTMIEIDRFVSKVFEDHGD